MAPYLTLEQLRAVDALANEETYPDDLLIGLVSEFEELAERYRGTAFTERERTWVTASIGRNWWASSKVVLPDLFVTAVTDASYTLDGVVTTIEEIDVTIIHGDLGVIDLGQSFSGTLSVTYTYGLATPPPAVLRACREYVRAEALADRSQRPRNAISTTDPTTGLIIRDSTANWDEGRPTGWLTVDRLLNGLPDHRRVLVG